MKSQPFVTRQEARAIWDRVQANRERLQSCSRHDFEPVPEWRSYSMLSKAIATCRRCGGEMRGNDVATYLRGVAAGSGENFSALFAAVYPDVPATVETVEGAS